LGLLPLHAARVANPACPSGWRYAMDDICFRYAPSARALQEAQQQVEQLQTTSLLMVEDPQDTLDFSALAAQAAMDLFSDCTHLGKAQATWQAVREQIPLHEVLYFFCHGIAEFDHPLQSGLELADRRLTLADILDAHLERTRLAVLSACETGIPSDLRAVDEVTSLPTGLIQAGVPGVVGSLWSVSEVSTVLLMVLFFDLWRKKGCLPAEALRQAQILLREMNSGALTNFLKQEIPADLKMMMPAAVAEKLYTYAALSDFSHPFFWSAFFYSGV
jgi:CHAT domain-containing protein